MEMLENIGVEILWNIKIYLDAWHTGNKAVIGEYMFGSLIAGLALGVLVFCLIRFVFNDSEEEEEEAEEA